ncbi:SpoIIE family protein phosphatase [Methylomusa anaerophila]|uniref:Stage II sporulation protein E n=1 Tax=Methylomusa anaerophila TaxID=1930071 RepID=A0A348AR19_9FIRM|nr:SpoIIE family protein phosphatase [Methylomusa anaerophila]BBB93517.1 stage II sporulation protein E [Methylomusa anaerophila]
MKNAELDTLEQLRIGIRLLAKGRYPDTIAAEGCSELVGEIVYLFNQVAGHFRELYEYAVPLTKGSLNVKRPDKTNFLAGSLKELHSRLNHLTWQAQQIEKGDYKQRVDLVGEFFQAFNSLVIKLEEREQRLKEEILVCQQAEAEVRAQNKLITDSIHYGAVIQQSILPELSFLENYIAESFVIWRPRDIVGGDFYWCAPCTDGFMAAVIDCTGHGVPGAFMTIAVNQMIKRLLDENANCQPADVLALLDKKIHETFYTHSGSKERLYVGLDMGLVKVNTTAHKVVFAGARLPLFFVHSGKIKEIPGSRRSIGYDQKSRLRKKLRIIQFENREFGYEPGDGLYLSTDGFFDQHGENPNPFSIDNFSKLITENFLLPMTEQRTALLQNLETYMGMEEQLDDITVMGLKF